MSGIDFDDKAYRPWESSPEHNRQQLADEDALLNASLRRPSSRVANPNQLGVPVPPIYHGPQSQSSGRTNMSEAGVTSPSASPASNVVYNAGDTALEDPRPPFRTSGGHGVTGPPHDDEVFDHEYLYGCGMQLDSNDSFREPPNVPLLYLGAQFGTEAQEAIGQPYGADAIEFFPSAIGSEERNGASRFAGKIIRSPDRDRSVTARKSPNYTWDGDQHAQGITPYDVDRPDVGSAWGCSAGLPTYGNQRPAIIVVDQEGRTAIPMADDLCRSWLTDDLTPADVVQEAYGLAQVFYDQWVPKLASPPELYARCVTFTPEILFREGLRTLSCCYKGNLPSSFQNLFPLMLVAFAFSHVIYKDSTSCYWDGFSQDVYRWHQALSESDERRIFVMVWHRLWYPQAAVDMYMRRDDLQDATSPSPLFGTWDDSVMSHAIPQPTPSSIGSTQHQRPSHQSENDLASLLMSGMVIGGCSRFLDTVENAYINERNAKDPPRSQRDDDANGVIESLIGPLQRCHAAVLFPQHIANAFDQFRNGLLRNVRELEVVLTCCREVCVPPRFGQWSRIPRQAQSTYLDQVAMQCDIAEKQPNSNWRYRYYIVDLGLVIGLFNDLDQQQQPVPSTWPQSQSIGGHHVAFDELYDLDRSAPFDVPSSASVPPFTSLVLGASAYCNNSSSDTSHAGPAPLQTADLWCAATSLVASSDYLSDNSLSSSQSVSEPSSRTSATVTTCPHCPNRTFEGAPRSQRRNWRRHMRSEHSEDRKLKCPECIATFKLGRYDNLKRHLRKKHGIATPLRNLEGGQGRH